MRENKDMSKMGGKKKKIKLMLIRQNWSTQTFCPGAKPVEKKRTVDTEEILDKDETAKERMHLKRKGNNDETNI